jgi:Mn2+/Fe2+ NRAMP family transporter
MNNNSIVTAPQGKERLKWLGPAFIWMLSAAGSGELLFTPRIASQYGYTLVWALVIAVLMKWFINREIGRYTVCTGETFFSGLQSVSEKNRILIWLIVIPQLVVAVAIIAGLAGAAATAILTLFNVSLWISSLLIILISSCIIALGKYKVVEKITTILAIVISLSVLTAAISTGPDLREIGNGFDPKVPQDLKFDELLSWLGFMLAGAAGLMWFSYWTQARGYGAASLKEKVDVNQLSNDQKNNLKAWIKHMTIANTLAVFGALLIAFAFLILGTELLKPKNLIPEENKVAETLAQLLGGVWGQFGFQFMLYAIFVTFLSTMLSAQDGFGRMFADGMKILTGNFIKPGSKWANAAFLQRIFVIVLLGIFPAILYLIVGEPVGLLKVAGVIEACHIPVVAILILYINRKKLPEGLRPSAFSSIATAVAGLTFLMFAVAYILSLMGIF